MIDKQLTILPVERETWGAFERLFEERAGPKSCWCMVWRNYARTKSGNDKDDRKRGMHEMISSGQTVGLLAFLDDDPVAWCSVAPRQSFKASLDGGLDVGSDNTWSLTCLFVKRAHRGTGLSDKLIEAAADYARSNGATALDAYPVDPDSPSYRFCGFVPQFDRHGFEACGKVGSRRHLVTKRL